MKLKWRKVQPLRKECRQRTDGRAWVKKIRERTRCAINFQLELYTYSVISMEVRPTCHNYSWDCYLSNNGAPTLRSWCGQPKCRTLFRRLQSVPTLYHLRQSTNHLISIFIHDTLKDKGSEPMIPNWRMDTCKQRNEKSVLGRNI